MIIFANLCPRQNEQVPENLMSLFSLQVLLYKVLIHSLEERNLKRYPGHLPQVGSVSTVVLTALFQGGKQIICKVFSKQFQWFSLNHGSSSSFPSALKSHHSWQFSYKPLYGSHKVLYSHAAVHITEQSSTGPCLTTATQSSHGWMITNVQMQHV